MTLIEFSVALSTVSGAVGGGLAGREGGNFLTAAGGTAAGAFLGMMAAALATAVTGVLALRVDPDKAPSLRPLKRLCEVAFVLLVILLCVAPIWVPFLTYHLVGFFARG